jgi:Uma2 family endonuclease
MTVAAPDNTLLIVNNDGETILDLDLDQIQGLWTPKQYLKLTNATSRLIEFANGNLEVLVMPTRQHQAILGRLYVALLNFLQPRGGAVFFSPLRLQIPGGTFREPDILLLCDADDPRGQNDYWRGADLVLEVVSPDDPERDTVVKRGDYAEAGIPEYWIVYPDAGTITVLRLVGGAYREHGVFQRGDTATSVLLDGFAVDVQEVLDAK